MREVQLQLCVCGIIYVDCDYMYLSFHSVGNGSAMIDDSHFASVRPSQVEVAVGSRAFRCSVNRVGSTNGGCELNQGWPNASEALMRDGGG